LFNNGVIPTHIDSHHHYHTEWAIGREVIKIARENNIQSIRLSRDIGKSISIIKRIYKGVFNMYLNLSNLAGVKYFGSVNDCMNIKNANLHSIEIMVHPTYDKEGRLIEASNGEELKSLIREIRNRIDENKFSLYLN